MNDIFGIVKYTPPSLRNKGKDYHGYECTSRDIELKQDTTTKDIKEGTPIVMQYKIKDKEDDYINPDPEYFIYLLTKV